MALRFGKGPQRIHFQSPCNGCYRLYKPPDHRHGWGIKRTQPDIVSEPETRKVKQGQIIPSMGCRSLLAPCWEENVYPIDTKFYFVKGTGTYPYGKFVDKKTFEDFENRNYKTGYEEGEVAILFAGNTGWLKSKNRLNVLQIIEII